MKDDRLRCGRSGRQTEDRLPGGLSRPVGDKCGRHASPGRNSGTRRDMFDEASTPNPQQRVQSPKQQSMDHVHPGDRYMAVLLHTSRMRISHLDCPQLGEDRLRHRTFRLHRRGTLHKNRFTSRGPLLPPRSRAAARCGIVQMTGIQYDSHSERPSCCSGHWFSRQRRTDIRRDRASPTGLPTVRVHTILASSEPIAPAPRAPQP